jgi:hypothetical protein
VVKEAEMGEREEIKSYLYELIGEEGCGISCDNAELFRDEEGWKLRMEGFMEPWRIGATVGEAKKTLKDLTSQRFGLS